MQTTGQALLWSNGQKWVLGVVLAAWFAFASFIGIGEILANTHSSIFPPVAITVVIPVTLFLAFYAISSRFRRFILSQDIKFLTMMQLWRVIGFTFLPLYAYGVLPGLFGWVAGVGDVAVGLFAILVVSRLYQNPDYVMSKSFRWFHYFGMLDFIGALATAALSSGAVPALVFNGVTSGPLDVWPLNLFPSFIVPCFIIMHLCVLLQVRHLAQNHNVSQITSTVSG